MEEEEADEEEEGGEEEEEEEGEEGVEERDLGLVLVWPYATGTLRRASRLSGRRGAGTRVCPTPGLLTLFALQPHACPSCAPPLGIHCLLGRHAGLHCCCGALTLLTLDSWCLQLLL